MVSENYRLGDHVEREFAFLEAETQQLALAMLGQKIYGTDERILRLAKNLQQSDFVVQAAERVERCDPLVIRWDDWLELVVQECLLPFDEVTYWHSIRMNKVIVWIRQLVNKYGLGIIPDLGFVESRYFSETFQLTEKDWQHLEWATKFHDICKMCLDQTFWNYPGRYNRQQRSQLEIHARMFYYLGELFHVDSEVIALAVLHHKPFPRTGYPADSLIDCVMHYYTNPKFRIKLGMLILLDRYEAWTSDRSYKKAVSHPTAISKVSKDQSAGNIVQSLSSVLDRVKEEFFPGDSVLCAVN